VKLDLLLSIIEIYLIEVENTFWLVNGKLTAIKSYLLLPFV
jgi:hypothetical protein